MNLFKWAFLIGLQLLNLLLLLRDFKLQLELVALAILGLLLFLLVQLLEPDLFLLDLLHIIGLYSFGLL